MHGFEGEIIIKKINASQYRVWKDLSYTTKENYTWTVPHGFITDGASIPPIVWPIVGSPFTGLYTGAALVHDWLYHIQETTRWYADRVFLEAMVVLKVPLWKRTIMWLAVRFGGGVPWNLRENQLNA